MSTPYPELAVAQRRSFLIHLAAALALGTLPGAAWASARGPAFVLAADASPDVDPAGYLVSEKLDGVRAQWDGRRLLLRGGGTVVAPAWFVEGLPRLALDGELWLGRGQFDAVSGLVRSSRVDDPAWRALRYRVFELPHGKGDFEQRARRLQELAAESPAVHWQAVEQVRISDRAALRKWLDQVVDAGGEGLMLHRADAPYLTGRSQLLLKLKPVQDAEALVLKHLPGRGRHQGRLGALLVQSADGRAFRLGTGLSDALRNAPPPVGSVLTYTYRGLTPGGLPRFASFLRMRPAI